MEMILKYFSSFSDIQLKQFEVLHGLYEEWNKKINVISRKDMDNFYEHHVLHSLSIAVQFNFPGNFQVMDLGCGGGFPGLPVAIFYPNVHFHLVDSVNKKLTVVKEIADTIGLKNVTVQHTRVEEIKNKKFDAIISRAVAPLKDLWKWSKPLLIKSNNFIKSEEKIQPSIASGLICLKGGDLAKEIFDSGCRPQIWEIKNFFALDFFEEKYLLQIAY